MGFLSYSAMDAIKAIELPRGEFLLIFQSLGIFVDSQGRKSRDREIMYPSDLIDASKLCIFFKPYGLFNIVMVIY
jgi:serine/threonine-protein kinase MRCK